MTREKFEQIVPEFEEISKEDPEAYERRVRWMALLLHELPFEVIQVPAGWLAVCPSSK